MESNDQIANDKKKNQNIFAFIELYIQFSALFSSLIRLFLKILIIFFLIFLKKLFGNFYRKRKTIRLDLLCKTEVSKCDLICDFFVSQFI